MLVLTQSPYIESEINRTQIVLNQDFIGKSIELEHRKRQRRKFSINYQTLANEVRYLNKNNQKLQKETQKQQNHLQYASKIKQRKKAQKEQKQIKLNKQNIHLLNLHQKINNMKQVHYRNTSSSLNTIKDCRRQSYQQSKTRQKQGENKIKYQIQKDLQQKHKKLNKINYDKCLGSIKIVNFKSQRNKKHIKDYNKNTIKQELKELQNQKTQATTIFQKRMHSKNVQIINSLNSIQLQGQQGIRHSRSKPLKPYNLKGFKTRSISHNLIQFNTNNPQNIQRNNQFNSQLLSKSYKKNKEVQLDKKSDIYSIIKRITQADYEIQNKFRRKSLRNSYFDK